MDTTHRSMSTLQFHIISQQTKQLDDYRTARMRVVCIHVAEVDMTTGKLMCRECDNAEFPCPTLHALRLDD